VKLLLILPEFLILKSLLKIKEMQMKFFHFSGMMEINLLKTTNI
jgi:hypothetical protein